MLRISEIQIGHSHGYCITDVRPNIRFSLESDIQCEAMDYAIISCGDWKIRTSDQINNVYLGEFLPFTEYEVKIEVFGKSGERAIGYKAFRAGRLDTQWIGKWITDSAYSFPEKASPVPMIFKKSFMVTKPIKRAWMNSTALGIYEICLNGEKVGEDYFAPGFTSYKHQIQYQTYDLTEILTKENTLSVTVAGGWAVGSFTYNRKSHISGDRQAFLGEIHIEYVDGTKEIIATDESWSVTEDGPVKMAEWYDGETYDASYDEGKATLRAASITSPKGNPKLLAQYGESVRALATMEPIEVFTATNGETIYDFGQNFAGVVSFRITDAKAGQTITFRHAELMMDGDLFVKSLRTAKATMTYICKTGEQTYSPRFTYMGFRYIGMSGIAPDAIEVKALVLHSDISEIGFFACSNPLLNRLNENIKWGGKSNFMDIPTDCPQRDERQGWTGDTAVFSSTACFNFDMSRFYDKWLLDVIAEQGIGGGIPMVVPKQGDAFPPLATACWGDACVLVPWAEYLARGDKELLKRQYPSMKKFVKAARRWAFFFGIGPNKSYIWEKPFQFGDWCAPEGSAKEWMARGKWIATAYLANSCQIMSKAADILGRYEDVNYFEKLREKVIKAYRAVFTDGKGRLTEEFQSAYVLPLFFGMTEDDETKNMASNLARMLKENDYKIGTGFPSTPYLLFALSDYGYLEEAYKVLLQEECPGWLYEVKVGGTTCWERWDALKPDGTVNFGNETSEDDANFDGGMVSFNHYSLGAVGDWLYRRIAGIEATSGGYKTFIVAPKPGGGISWADASIVTPYGKASVAWKIINGQFEMMVQVPVSTTCFVELPNGEKKELGSGEYSFCISLE